jgi:hypothetical protein
MTVMDDLDVADNPRLIRALASLMQTIDFDLMAFQRVLYNTRAYQAQVSPTPEEGVAYRFPGPVLRRMTAEQAWDSLVTLAEGDKVNQYKRTRKLDSWVEDVFKEGVVEAMNGKKPIEFEPLIDAASKLSGELVSEVVNGRGSRRKSTFGDESIARASERPQPEADDHFLRQFGQSERELADAASSEGGIPQVLMLLNGDEHEMLAKPNSYVMHLVKNAGSQSAQIDLLYLSFFSRNPTGFERSYLARERIDLGDLTWILMNSREFIFVQ